MSRRGHLVRPRVRFKPHARIAGFLISPPVSPPEVESIPWNSLTLALTVPTKTLYSSDRLFVVIRKKLSLSSNASIDVRFLSFCAWLREDPGLSLMCKVCSLYPGQVSYLSTLECSTGKLEYARVGYSWPLCHQAQTITLSRSNLKSTGIFYFDAKCVSTCVNYAVYVQLTMQWKPSWMKMPAMNDCLLFNELRVFSRTVVDAGLPVCHPAVPCDDACLLS